MRSGTSCTGCKLPAPNERLRRELEGGGVVLGGCNAVQVERDHVDIEVRTETGTTVMELKSSTDARRAIRDALGQLLDYAYRKDGGAESRLVVVGQGVPTESDLRFLQTLRIRFRIPVNCQQYVLGSGRFTL